VCLCFKEELCFQSGDVITVCGEVDDDGFFMVCIRVCLPLVCE